MRPLRPAKALKSEVWTDSQRDVFEDFIPNFIYRLIELADIPFDKILGTPLGILTLRVLKAEPRDELLGDMV